MLPHQLADMTVQERRVLRDQNKRHAGMPHRLKRRHVVRHLRPGRADAKHPLRLIQHDQRVRREGEVRQHHPWVFRVFAQLRPVRNRRRRDIRQLQLRDAHDEERTPLVDGCLHHLDRQRGLPATRRRRDQRDRLRCAHVSLPSRFRVIMEMRAVMPPAMIDSPVKTPPRARMAAATAGMPARLLLAAPRAALTAASNPT
uniref:Uncharacterized protein n=1 Tax=Ralstonia solanacearum TaxID=305 RepID=O82967_RALSL|nr:unnamed protein product [Ralstonia solanacearum]